MYFLSIFQLMTKGCALSTDNLPRGGLPRNSVDRITDRPDMSIHVYYIDQTMYLRSSEHSPLKHTCNIEQDCKFNLNEKLIVIYITLIKSLENLKVLHM